MRRYLADYFTPGMEMLRRDANMLHALLKKTSPSVHRHLEKHNVEPFLYVSVFNGMAQRMFQFYWIGPKKSEFLQERANLLSSNSCKKIPIEHFIDFDVSI